MKSRRLLLPAVSLMAMLAAASQASAESPGGPASLPAGQIITDVQCDSNHAQHYALYIPSNFTPDRKWPVILGFDAGGRGERAVERYKEGAEKYGFIVAGSNNSKNGPWQVSLDAAAAMTADVTSRFPVDPKRMYTAGMSGGARVAMMLALSSDRIAGVLASSAGFPDEFHDTVRFPVFGSMGTEDFNHDEMTKLDHDLKSPHRVEEFVGTHEWLPVALATDGVEWMEIQAMKSSLRPRDQQEIDAIFARRLARADAQPTSYDKMRELKSVADDFQGLEDVRSISSRVSALVADAAVKAQVKEHEAAEAREDDITYQLFTLVQRLASSRSGDAFSMLNAKVLALYDQSKAPADSTDRRIARRVLARLSASTRDIDNPQFQALLNQIRPARPAGGEGPQ